MEQITPMKDLSHRAAFLVVFGYDGAPFYGLQPQPDRPTAGGALKTRIEKALGAPPRGLAFAARTDRGVHAWRNVATFWTPAAEGGVPLDDNDVARIAAGIMADADDHLRVHAACRVPAHTHARAVGDGKHYRYRIKDSQPSRAIDDGDDDDGDDGDNRDDDAWCVVPALDVDAMREAAVACLGKHDFSSLRGGGCTAGTVEKTITRLDVARGDDGVVVVDVEGDAFLRHMVRNLAGVLAEVGSGWRVATTIPAMLAARHRQAAGLMAPPHGLTLVEVKLRPEVALRA
jgi:tRNA pseudouridine38-40 synthase